MKRCSLSLIIKEIQIQITVYYFTFHVAVIKKLDKFRQRQKIYWFFQ